MNQIIFNILIALLIFINITNFSLADERENHFPEKLKIGFIGSLSSFAANYGTAVLRGAELAIEELKASGVPLELKIEDDQSSMKNTSSAYLKLKSIEQVDAIIGGSWWINAIVKQSEKDGIPLISSETLYNADVILGNNYFILQGDLRDWINVYRPLINQEAWKRGAIIRYTSGFGATLAKEMENIFSEEDREFLGDLEYTDVNIPNASDLILKLKRLRPEVIYIDGQPAGLATLLKKIKEANLVDLNILTNSIAEDVKRDNLIELDDFKNIYFTKRAGFEETFIKKYELKFKEKPYLNADLGYYSVYLLAESFKSKDPISKLKNGLTVQGQTFTFSKDNVSRGIPQVITKITNQH